MAIPKRIQDGASRSPTWRSPQRFSPIDSSTFAPSPGLPGGFERNLRVGQRAEYFVSGHLSVAGIFNSVITVVKDGKSAAQRVELDGYSTALPDLFLPTSNASSLTLAPKRFVDV